jgi:hypothetical protein
MKKSLAFISLLALAACGGSPPPPQNFAPLDYSYLRPFVFKVANISVVNNYVPGPDEAQLNANNPAPPAPALLAMLNHRMQPSGAPGNGTITVQTASITEGGGNLNGQMTVDINLTSGDGRSTGFAEATVSATQPAPDGDNNAPDMQAALYQMTKKLMDEINVQLPYSITHNIPSWVDWTNPQAGGPAAAAGAIQATPLTGPPGSPDASPAASPDASPATSTVTTTTTTVTPGAPVPLTPAPLPPTATPGGAMPPTGNLIPPGYPGIPVPSSPAQ